MSDVKVFAVLHLIRSAVQMDTTDYVGLCVTHMD